MLLLACTALLQASPLTLGNLRCEYRVDPLGVDTTEPRLSWNLSGDNQSAYEIQVSSAKERISSADMWSTGKVATDRCIQIPYKGKPLASNGQYYWRVRAWDSKGVASPWSEPAKWSMGLLAQSDWTAKWIGYQVPSQEDLERASLKGVSWIWLDEGDPRVKAPHERVLFTKVFDTPRLVPAKSAVLAITADNEFAVTLNGKRLGEGSNWGQTYVFDAAPYLRSGKNVLYVSALNTIPSPAGMIAKLTARFAGAPDVNITTDSTWTAMKVAPDKGEVSQARVIAQYGDAPWTGAGAGLKSPLPLFRKTFSLRKPLRRATAYVCGLGSFEARLNGGKLGDETLAPGWTDFRKRVLYSSFDITSQLKAGKNIMTISLGNGMYNQPGERYERWTGTFGPPKAIAQIELLFADGSHSQIVTDGTWQATKSPVTFSSIYGGEDYDARLESGAKWVPASVTSGPGGRLVASSAPPVKIMQVLSPIYVMHPKKGIEVYDLGQNMSAKPRIRVSGEAGATIKLTPAELLGKDGLVDQGSGGGGPTYYKYTLKGGGDESWNPQFSYYGFRYVQVETTGKVLIKDLRGLFTYAGAEQTGTFECSDALLNRIHRLILAAIKSNLQSVLTDCPHREKLGWLEVSQLLGPSMINNYDLATFYGKVADDIADAQHKDGLVPTVAPEYTHESGPYLDSPEWGSAAVLNPWNMYRRYGDTRLFGQHYDTMARYVRYLQSKSKGGIVSYGLGDWYDVGPGPLGESQLTSRGVTATVTYCQDLYAMAVAANLLGKPKDAAMWSGLAQDVRNAFNTQFLDPVSGRYDKGSQTAQAMPLSAGITPPDAREAVLKQLVDAVRENGNRVTAGDVGFTYLVRALMNGGRSDVLYDMLTQKNGPGYWYQLQQGATSLTEAWDAERKSSWNHCMLGHAEEWFMTGLAGIRLDPVVPAYKKFVIHPEPVGDVSWVKCGYRSPYGLIRSDWTVHEGKMTLTVVIPFNTTAQVEVPGSSLTADGAKVNSTPSDGRATFTVGGGTHVFVSDLTPKVAPAPLPGTQPTAPSKPR